MSLMGLPHPTRADGRKSKYKRGFPGFNPPDFGRTEEIEIFGATGPNIQVVQRFEVLMKQ